MICKKTMRECAIPRMCSPYQGCAPAIINVPSAEQPASDDPIGDIQAEARQAKLDCFVRAAAPLGSANKPAGASVDGPAFQNALSWFATACHDPYCKLETKAVEQTAKALIAQINAWGAQQREAGRRESETKCKALIIACTKEVEQANRVQASCKAAEKERDDLREELAHWKVNHDQMAARCAILRERDDLPVDRLPAYRELMRLQSAVAQPSQPTDISRQLRKFAGDPGYIHGDYADVMRRAADECERFYGGMMAWKQTAEKKDADWNAERMGRVNDRITARKSPPANSDVGTWLIATPAVMLGGSESDLGSAP